MEGMVMSGGALHRVTYRQRNQQEFPQWQNPNPPTASS